MVVTGNIPRIRAASALMGENTSNLRNAQLTVTQPPLAVVPSGSSPIRWFFFAVDRTISGEGTPSPTLFSYFTPPCRMMLCEILWVWKA